VENWNPRPLLVGGGHASTDAEASALEAMQHDLTTVQKVKIELTYSPAIPLLVYTNDVENYSGWF
jgi:hypothetical protein